MTKNVNATPIMEHELSLIQQDVNTIAWHLKQKKEPNETFTFYVLSGNRYSDSIGVNKKHISCYRLENDNKKLIIFFSGNDEPVVFQMVDKEMPNYLDSTQCFWAFCEWFDGEYIVVKNND